MDAKKEEDPLLEKSLPPNEHGEPPNGQIEDKDVAKLSCEHNQETKNESAIGGSCKDMKNADVSETKVNGKLDEQSDDEDYKSCAGDEEYLPRPPVPRVDDVDSEPDEGHSNPRNQKWSEALKAKLFASVDKDSNFFSYMFLDKIFGEARPCRFCGARGTAKLPPKDDSMKLCVLEDGIVGRQNVLCTRCLEIDTVVSCDDIKRFPTDDRLSITGSEIRLYCRTITHYEILHDLMEMLHIAATDDDSQRQVKHHEVADFMLKNVRKVCEEWCRPEYAELRLKKYLRLRDETLLTTYNPTFTPDCTEEYKEMYEMMANSFRQNRDKVLLLLQLMKESLIDSPTRSTFMMWVSIAMMHSESYSQFKAAYDPRSFMRVDSSEYQALQDRYLALEVPLGIKKIPVIFILFEIPRFYHYVEFLNQRIGKKKSRNYLTEEERAMLQSVEEETVKLGLKMKPRTGKMVSPEAHLDFLTRQEEYGREMIYQSCRDKEKAKQQKLKNALKAATAVKSKHTSSTASREESSSPSTSRKSESSKLTSASSKDSSNVSGAVEKEKSLSVASEGTRHTSNKKKRKKNRLLGSEPVDLPPSMEEKIKKIKMEEEARKKREEFISKDTFQAILRETLAASEASKGTKEEEEEEDRKKKRSKRRFKREMKEEMEAMSSLKEEKNASPKRDKLPKEEKLSKESSEKEEKKLPKDEVKSPKEERKSLPKDKGDCSNEVKTTDVEETKAHGQEAAMEATSTREAAKVATESVESDKNEKQKKSSEEPVLPKLIKPEVNPESPLANVSLPPRPGSDPNRKPITLPDLEATAPLKKYMTRSSLKKELREQVKATKRHKKSGRDSRTVLCAQVDTEMLRAQGYKITGDSPVTTVIANSDGTIEHILEGLNTPEQVKAFLGRRYSILNQAAGSGYLTMPSKNDPGALVVDEGEEINPFINSAAAKFHESNTEPKPVGNPKKRKKVNKAQEEHDITSLMDCYNHQRQQSQPGSWKASMEEQQRKERMAGVLDKEMCGALGGGNLTKALSNAYEKREKSGKGLPGIDSYRIHDDGSVLEDDTFSLTELSCSNGEGESGARENGESGSTSSMDSEKSSTIKDDKCEGGSIAKEENGESVNTEKDQKSESKSAKDRKSESGSTEKGEKTRSGSANKKNKKNKGGGTKKDDKSTSGSAKRDEKNDSGSTKKDDKSTSGSAKRDEKNDSGSTKKDDKSTSGSSRRYGKSMFRDEGSRMRGSRRSLGYRSWRGMPKPAVKDKYCVANPKDLVPVGKMTTAGWSDAKRDLFKNGMCRGLDEKVFTVENEDEARAVVMQAMRPTDLGKLEGPCPRYIVPSAGGVGHLTGNFPLPETGDIKDLDEFLKSPFAPRQQMLLMDYKRFPYKLETTKIYIKRKDKHGNELPDKVTMVSKTTLLPKELADRYCSVGDAGAIMELTDSEDVDELDFAEIEELLEIEGPPDRGQPPPTIITSGKVTFDTPPSGLAVESLTKIITETLASNSKLKNVPISMEAIESSVKEVLADMKSTNSFGALKSSGLEDDTELAISLNDESVKNKLKDSKDSGAKRKKLKKKVKKPKSVASNLASEPRPPSPTFAMDEPPVAMERDEVGVVDIPTSKDESVVIRDIDDIDDIDIGVSEDLLKGAGIGGGVTTAVVSSSSDDLAAKQSQSKMAAREKFRSCDNCSQVIEERILVCSSCKRVAYCNRKCQKAHWKSHKKTCSHKAGREDCTG